MNGRTYKGLALFSRTSSNSAWIVAAYHSPHSLTWRWVLGWHKWVKDTDRVVWKRLIFGHRTNGGGNAWITFPWLGRLHWSWQEPMWYRDLYWNLRDQDGRDAEMIYQTRMRQMADQATHRESGSIH